MDGVVRHVGEERPVPVVLDEGNRLLGDISCQVACVVYRRPVAVDRAGVVRDGEVEIVVPAMAQKSVERVEAPLQWPVRRCVAQMPLAEDAGGVTMAAEDLCECGLRPRQPRPRIRSSVEAELLLVPACQQAGPGRRADRTARVAAGQACALPGDPIKVRGLDLVGVRVAADVRVALVVRDDQDHVRSGASRYGDDERNQGSEQGFHARLPLRSELTTRFSPMQSRSCRLWRNSLLPAMTGDETKIA